MAVWNAPAFWAPAGPELVNFDRRPDGADAPAAAEREPAVKKLRTQLPDLRSISTNAWGHRSGSWRSAVF